MMDLDVINERMGKFVSACSYNICEKLGEIM